MSEDQEEYIVVKPRRDSGRGNGSQGKHGGANGSQNGKAHHGETVDEVEVEVDESEPKKKWGWTRPFSRESREERDEDFRDPEEEHEEQPRSKRQHVFEEERPRKRLTYEDAPSEKAPKPASDVIKLPFDPWRLLTAMQRRWWWIVLGTVLLGAAGYLASGKLVKYKVSLNLQRRLMDSAVFTAAEGPGQQKLSDATIYAFMRSGGLLARVANRAATNVPPVNVSAKQLSEMVGVTPTGNPDMLVISMSGTKNSPDLATLLNLYAREVALFTKEIQSSEAAQVALILSNRLASADKELEVATQKLLDYQKEANVLGTIEKENENYLKQISEYDNKIEFARMEINMLESTASTFQRILAQQTPQVDRTRALKEEYEKNKASMTDLHPTQIQLKKQIEILEKSTNVVAEASSSTSIANPAYLPMEEAKSKKTALEKRIFEYERLKEETRKKVTGLSNSSIEYGTLKARIASLEAGRLELATRERNMRLFVENALGFYQVIGEASPQDINWRGRIMKVALLTIMGAGTGFVIALLLAFFCEATDTTLKTVIDIERITDLKVIASLGDLNKMTEAEKDEWAFQTLTLLRGKLCRSLDGGMVCGFISSDPGEGCSTWVNLLRKAGREMGFTVYTPPSDEKPLEPQPGPNGEETAVVREPKLLPETATGAEPQKMAVAVADKPSMAMIDQAARGIWDAEARQKLRADLEKERRKNNHVMLIDLPPASTREGILLAQRFPQLVWLTRSGMADVKKTREQLKMLKAAKCKIVGAVLNGAPPPPVNARLARWFKWSTSSMILIGLNLFGGVQAQEGQAPTRTNETKLAFSATGQQKRAKWQERLTLGPGDAMDISLYGQPNLTRTNIFVGPDGRISYLQAQGITATGMTIEELRERLDQELAKYYTAPRTIVIPVQFSSKKYYVLGKVANKGVFPLDRPMTIVEAVARAQGLETGLYDRMSVDLTDLSRSFLVRAGTREKVDLEKLFSEGDLSQNIQLEPEDFLYFASSSAREIYVLGEVAAPGPIGFVAAPTLMSALADRGGFTDRAWKGKVLVVRGSLNKPETYVVNAKAIFDASEKDFKLESRDIIYVSHRPWIRAEELLDEATQSFIQGFVTAFSGVKIGPFIKNPIFGD